MIFCKNCGAEVEPSLQSYVSEFEYNNNTYAYKAYKYCCPRCNSLIDDNPVQNIESREDAIKRAMDSSSHI